MWIVFKNRLNYKSSPFCVENFLKLKIKSRFLCRNVLVSRKNGTNKKQKAKKTEIFECSLLPLSTYKWNFYFLFFVIIDDYSSLNVFSTFVKLFDGGGKKVLKLLCLATHNIFFKCNFKCSTFMCWTFFFISSVNIFNFFPHSLCFYFVAKSFTFSTFLIE